MKRSFSSALSTHGTGTSLYIYKRLRFVPIHQRKLDDGYVIRLNRIAFWATPCTASVSILFSADA